MHTSYTFIANSEAIVTVDRQHGLWTVIGSDQTGRCLWESRHITRRKALERAKSAAKLCDPHNPDISKWRLWAAR